MAETIPHPRETFDWAGPTDHEDAFLGALARGRLHHAWMVTGPQGLGKATFAYRAARRLLGAAPDAERGPLGASRTDPVSRQIIGRAHPDLLVLQRDPEDGKTRRNIPVEEARELSVFFSKSPAAAPYRVAIIDTADDLNTGAANALLKTLEEPPARGVIFLLATSPGALLPTIRSRCRRVAVHTPERAEAAAWVAARAGVSGGDAARLLDMALGARGAAWRLAGLGALDAAETASRLVAALPAGDEKAALALAEGFRGAQGATRFALLFDCLADEVRARALSCLRDDAANARAEAWSRAWTELMALRERVEAVNLDRGEAFLVTLSRLQALG
jgi:DNA polymerase-3 subunit delta'